MFNLPGTSINSLFKSNAVLREWFSCEDIDFRNKCVEYSEIVLLNPVIAVNTASNRRVFKIVLDKILSIDRCLKARRFPFSP